MDIHAILDQLDEIIYISDPKTYELLYLNQCGRARFGAPAQGVKCYAHLHGAGAPCKFCTNEILQHKQDNRYTWVRQHSDVGNLLLHDSLVEYEGRLCHMEEAIDINRYIDELNLTKLNLAAERKLVECIEALVLSTDFNAAVKTMLEIIREYYAADRAYIFVFNWEQNVMNNTFEVCRDGVAPKIRRRKNVPIDIVSAWIDGFRTQQKKINIMKDVEVLRDNPDRQTEYEYLRKQGIRSLLTVPVFVNGRLYGFLGVDNPCDHADEPHLLSHVIYVASNELQKHRLTEQLQKQSRTDQLTNLRNRFAYDEVLRALQGCEKPVGVGFLDVNSLKWINDNLGHDYGNKAILRAGELLRATFSDESVYRISGDEFVVIQRDAEFSNFTKCCKKFASALRKEKDLAAFGYAWGQAEDVNELIRKAEQAMYTAKQKFYMEDGKDLDCRRPEYLDELLREYRESKFVPYLQPLYSIKKNEVYGAEVLVRKIDPKGGVHVPVEFIRVMEQEHMIPMVDYEMLRQSCELLVKWKDSWGNLVLNVNFSRVTLHETDCMAQVDQILKETGADPKQIIIEMTESSQGIQFERMAERLSELKERGFSIALDDMGTEAACLEMLYLPQLDVVKIDRSLICRSVNSEREKTVIEGLIELCHRLGMNCVAEGIENEEQVELLKQLKCDRLQGYHIGKPMPAGEFFERFRPKK